ncbi:MAG: ferredoxin family protein [Candidatus Thermoplasmatota archaeon]|jgi:NAD-dependent dihydropyrimidine dehydrogenase PreA subunit|nr:ferredoxin family protein [Candidatus Thermoplasmatota archaeon]MCL5963046.1 ferredoxin family protein [Candidatus Thermoplasmatota archaeon]MCL5963265.1 ferredoxin family protein [Candidatus Thermoplasmatota archaeon]
MVSVVVEASKCTGCAHCTDVCPVTVFELKPLSDPAFKGVKNDPAVEAKFKFRDKKSIAVRGSDCILCEACLFECEGECITITDDEGHTYKSVYK